MHDFCSVILAAGDGKRMKSQKPKVMCEILFKPMISWVAESVLKSGINNICAVIGENGGMLKDILPKGAETVTQEERLGTGHALKMAEDYLRGYKYAVVLAGDAPFISEQDITAAVDAHIKSQNDVTVLSAVVENPHGYGRIIRENSRLKAITEQKDATAEELKIAEINSGAFIFTTKFLEIFFKSMKNDNTQGEYYLTDCIKFAAETGKKADAVIVSPEAALGANDRKNLAELNEIARTRVINMHYENGVDIPFASGIVIGPDVKIGSDTVILPGTVIKGFTEIGPGCEIGPNTYIMDSKIGSECKVISSQIDSSTVKNGVKIGPMSNIRPNCVIENNVKIGDFVEVKNSNIGRKTSLAHLTYVGDSDIGEMCNFGCGVVFVNYDGEKKSRTTVGNNCFIGCNCNLISPLKIGDCVYAAAGTTITEDVPSEALVIGRAKQYIKLQWSKNNSRIKKENH